MGLSFPSIWQLHGESDTGHSETVSRTHHRHRHNRVTLYSVPAASGILSPNRATSITIRSMADFAKSLSGHPSFCQAITLYKSSQALSLRTLPAMIAFVELQAPNMPTYPSNLGFTASAQEQQRPQPKTHYKGRNQAPTNISTTQNYCYFHGYNGHPGLMCPHSHERTTGLILCRSDQSHKPYSGGRWFNLEYVTSRRRGNQL